MLATLGQCAVHGLIRELDLHFGRFVCQLAGSQSEELLLGACLVSRQVGEGDVCIDLRTYAGTRVLEDQNQAWRAGLVAPSLAQWRAALLNTSVVGRPGDQALLILDEQDRLYLGRYWHFEAAVARQLLLRACKPIEKVDQRRISQELQRLFPVRETSTDWQKVAVALAVMKRLCVLSGGPGTGKTRTVTRLLALLAAQAAPKKLRVALTAPTGKAAARLTESISQEKQHLAGSDSLRETLSGEAVTIHRLLQAVPGTGRFRHHAENPLHLDVLVVDEISMVDLSLMARLLDAVPAQTRLILLGDKDQLSSVEAGYVLGDIWNGVGEPCYSEKLRSALCELTGESLPPGTALLRSPLSDCLVLLQKSYRFAADSGIGKLASAVHRGQVSKAREVLRNPTWPDLAFYSPAANEIPRRIAERAASGYGSYLRANQPQQALLALNRFRVLCALREGPYGVAQVNRYVEEGLQRLGWIDCRERWYAGRPIMITRNDYGVRLFNGDIGVVLPDPEADQQLRVFFVESGGNLRRLLPQRLPEHVTAYAMTVHKSQGSEFDRVLMLLPPEDSKMATRELLYTGITRARQHLEIWGTEPGITAAIQRKRQRSSGLRQQLWG